MHIAVVAPCSSVDRYQRFGSICCGHPNGGTGTYQITWLQITEDGSLSIISGDGWDVYFLFYVNDVIYRPIL
jgi:hypothetical protein